MLREVLGVQQGACEVQVHLFCCLQDRIDSIVQASDQFSSAGHFDSDNITVKKANVVERYQAVMVSWRECWLGVVKIAHSKETDNHNTNK